MIIMWRVHVYTEQEVEDFLYVSNTDNGTILPAFSSAHGLPLLCDFPG